MPVTRRNSDQFQLRMPDGMRDQIKALGETNNRSMNAEIVAAIGAAIAGAAAEDERLARIEAKLDRLLAKENDR